MAKIEYEHHGIKFTFETFSGNNPVLAGRNWDEYLRLCRHPDKHEPDKREVGIIETMINHALKNQPISYDEAAEMEDSDDDEPPILDPGTRPEELSKRQLARAFRDTLPPHLRKTFNIHD